MLISGRVMIQNQANICTTPPDRICLNDPLLSISEARGLAQGHLPSSNQSPRGFQGPRLLCISSHLHRESHIDLAKDVAKVIRSSPCRASARSSLVTRIWPPAGLIPGGGGCPMRCTASAPAASILAPVLSPLILAPFFLRFQGF